MEVLYYIYLYYIYAFSILRSIYSLGEETNIIF